MNNTSSLKHKLQQLLEPAAIVLDGPGIADPQIHDDRFYARVISSGSLGLGEAYVDGWFDITQPEEFFYKVLRSGIENTGKRPDMLLPFIKSLIINEQNKAGSKKVARQHYDLKPELYMSFLDPYNQYSCCYFPRGNETLDEAAIKKLDLICRKLQLSSSDHVLDIGCGWGGFARYAAEHYGCRVTGISISEEQIKYARNYIQNPNISFLCADYREITGTYTRVLSCGMIEHVGYKNYRTLMSIVNKCLAKDGIFLLQTIGRNDSAISLDPWMARYVFPNSQLPSIQQLSRAVEQLFVVEDWTNLGYNYYHTLMAWHERFVQNWPQLQERLPEYDKRFYRMWTYYLLSCAGAFKARSIQLWQVVLTKEGMEHGYGAQILTSLIFCRRYGTHKYR